MGLRGYLAISKLRIVAVLDLVAITSLLAASRWNASAWDVAFLLLAGSMASMGASALNHYYDKDIDLLMSRTSKRPIPSGVMRARSALAYGLGMSIASVVIAVFTLNPVAASFIALGILFYVVIYTMWLKRRHTSNIVIGGFAGSCASYAGWATATGSLDPLGFLVGLIVFLWTPTHFWCLSIVGREEYANARVPMLPVLVGDKKAAMYILVNTIVLLPYSIAIAFLGLGVVYLIASIAAGVMLLYYNLMLVRNTTKEVAWRTYKLSSPYLAIVFIALMLDSIYHYPLPLLITV
ncbi:MAG: heme o synthase [Candidatus Nitrosocaldus sp.]|nr:heme o synthase [Candidatus Nitrosocaldus sp.]MCS7141447.1 heme o synthase [Candidatus Nitrosocaldus sp.]MDW7999653.1 heme o synthase [Candidatus Nitrosocaldus sp.]MDW8275307.1 heme o synthase [Candidatus Nitrosocaldus sp.]